MINLFDRVYVRHDNLFVSAQGQQTLIVTDKEFQTPYVAEKLARAEAGIIDICSNLDEVYEKFGGPEGLWGMLILQSAKIGIIADRYTVATLLIQFWKSIFAETTSYSLYQLYKLTINNENLHSFRAKERVAARVSLHATPGLIEKIDMHEFTILYEKNGPVDVLKALEPRHIPFEYLLMGYLAGNLSDKVRKVFFNKVDMIVRKNIAGELISARDDFFFETHNYYLLNGDGQEVIIEDPLDYIANHPMLAWALDPIFEHGKEDEVLAKYSLQVIKGFFETYHELFRYQFEDYHAIEFLQNKNYGGLIEFDMQDQKGNFFCSTAFVMKINGLLVSYIYQLKRLGQIDNLRLYKLNV